MKIKIFIITLLLVAVLGISSVAFAQTMTEAQRQTLIAQLQAQIATLTQQISDIIAQRQLQAGGVVATTGCYTFENNLGFAQSGTTDVVNLHTSLQKEGISYAPDDFSTYSTGTVEAVKKFQTKYKIVVNTAGYVGATTREKLNKLYGCVVAKCIPSWQNGPWDACVNNQQARTVTDLNNCGIITNKPAAVQACTIKPIDISIDNSDGPVDVFLTLGNGATVTSSGINLSKNINLKWTGTSVSSCTASDSLTPKIFSGYQPSTGSLTVILSGNIQTTATTNKISDTFKISCISTITGASVSDSVSVDIFYTASATCTPYWQTSAWSSCVGGKKIRTVTDANGCGSLNNKPTVTETCTTATCTPLWKAGDWGSCLSGQETRTVTDTNNCGIITNKPAISQTCCSAICLTQADGKWAVNCSGIPTKCATGKTCQKVYSTKYVYVSGVAQTIKTLTGTQCVTCTPLWKADDWGSCVMGQKNRVVTDTNNCGVTTGAPETNETCCSANCDGQNAISCSGVSTKCNTGETCQLTYSFVTPSILTGAQCAPSVGSCSASCLTQTDGVYAISCDGVTKTKCEAGKTCQVYQNSSGATTSAQCIFTAL